VSELSPASDPLLVDDSVTGPAAEGVKVKVCAVDVPENVSVWALAEVKPPPKA